jgi:hypothetical protein
MFEGVALRAARADQGHIRTLGKPGPLEGTMPHVTIRHDAIAQLFAEVRESFDSNGPHRVAVEALIPDRLGASVAAPTVDDAGRSGMCGSGRATRDDWNARRVRTRPVS